MAKEPPAKGRAASKPRAPRAQKPPVGNPAAQGTTKYAIYAALFKGGTISQIKKEAGKVFDKTVKDKTGNELEKARANLVGPYTNEAALRRELESLKLRGYKVETKGKGDDLYMRVSDGKA